MIRVNRYTKDLNSASYIREIVSSSLYSMLEIDPNKESIKGFEFTTNVMCDNIYTFINWVNKKHNKERLGEVGVEEPRNLERLFLRKTKRNEWVKVRVCAWVEKYRKNECLYTKTYLVCLEPELCEN